MPNKNSSAGFTIVETLIVLAIAGLMLSIIFLAIPTLQRNGRNNQRKQDVQTILQIVSRYELNNSGDIPYDRTLINLLAREKLSYYAPTDVALDHLDAGATASPDTSSNALDTVLVYNHQKCQGNDPTPQGAGFNDVVALYTIETASSQAHKCQEL